MSERDWTQIVVVHLSDFHFGKPHRFQPKAAPTGEIAPARGFPSLADSVLRDVTTRLAELHQNSNGAPRQLAGMDGDRGQSIRTVFTLTGDLTETADLDEFSKIQGFLDKIRNDKTFSPALTSDDIFIVPGNHDLIYDGKSPLDRWYRFCDFYRRHVDSRTTPLPLAIDANIPQDLTRIIDQSQYGLIVAEINSAAYVQKGTPDQDRGNIDEYSLAKLDSQLEAIDAESMRRSVRIAMIHHHPVVLPTLAEPGRGYDAVINAGPMLGLFKKYGFHVVLHGHKHDAQTFPHDSVSAWSGTGSQPMMVVSGGSVGSCELPTGAVAWNTYNIISIKWHPRSNQARVRIETRGLVRLDDYNQEKLPQKWTWRELRVDDRLLKMSGTKVASAAIFRSRASHEKGHIGARAQEIVRTRRCFPVVDVVPSLNVEQAFEARVWIDCQPDKPEFELPSKVIWDGGPFFPMVAEVHRKDDPTFMARFSYYGPAAIQARMCWPDGKEEMAYIFAHFPGVGPAVLNPPA